ncbi:MAG: hypothetical protein P8019_06775 [Gammaproteobacteria bacterium]
MVKIMKKYFLAMILVLFAFNAYASDFTGNVNFFLGQKSLKSSDWSPLENQTAFAVLVDFKQNNWPVSIAIDTLGSYKESTVSGIKFEGSTGEVDLGIRKIWDVSGTAMRPYVGGGIAFIKAKLQGTYGFTVSDEDNGVGYWLNGGIYWALTPHFNLGMDLRYSQAKVTLYGIEVEAGGTSAGLIAGYHW